MYDKITQQLELSLTKPVIYCKITQNLGKSRGYYVI